MIGSTPGCWHGWHAWIPACLSPVQHRSAEAQIHLTVIRARAATGGSAHGTGECRARVGEILRRATAKCGTQQVSRELAAGFSTELRGALEPLLAEVASLNQRIAEYDRRIEQIATEVHPEVALLKQVKGVGTLIALTYVLTVGDPHRFRRSRDVGCYLGLRPGRRNSGSSQPQLHISKEGDRYLRTLMVQGAHYILGPFGQDSDLRRWGLKLCRAGRKQCQETSRRCGRSQAVGAAAQVVGER